MKKLIGAGFLAVFATGCDDPELLSMFDTFACMHLPSVVQCTPEVQEKIYSVVTNGAAEGQIVCNGVAFNANFTKFVSVYYSAAKMHDGSCEASASLSVPGTVGFSVASGSDFTYRNDPDAAVCPVSTFHAPMSQSRITVEDGIIEVESQACTTSLGTTCTMLVDNCQRKFNEEAF